MRTLGPVNCANSGFIVLRIIVGQFSKIALLGIVNTWPFVFCETRAVLAFGESLSRDQKPDSYGL